LIVPSLLAVTPLPAVAEVTPAGSNSGGHALAHEPVHMIFPDVSVLSSYSVKPLASTRAVPTPGSAAVEIVVDPIPEGEPLPPPALEAVLFAHADRSISAPTKQVPPDRTLRLNIITIISLEAARRRRPHEAGSHAGNTFGEASRFCPAVLRPLHARRGLAFIER